MWSENDAWAAGHGLGLTDPERIRMNRILHHRPPRSQVDLGLDRLVSHGRRGHPAGVLPDGLRDLCDV